jgi:putative flavoprotein involved in K+ transport
MTLPRHVDAVVVGAGQAGLTMSWYLRRAGRDHVLLDRRDRLGGGWLDRWDTFRLVSPNWTASFPDDRYEGPEPDGFMSRDEIAGRVAAYARRISAPVELGTEVRRLRARAAGGFRVETSRGAIDAREAIVATGGYHVPRVPACAGALSTRVASLHAHAYRNERQLGPGGVLVVGSGQTGVQLVEELHHAGRRVFLSVGSAGRTPRRYRGKDVFVWLRLLAARGEELGTPLPSAEALADPRRRLAANPHVSGHGGGHDTDLRRLAALGVTLAGRLEAIASERCRFAADLSTHLAAADRFFDERFRALVDTAIARAGIEAPPDDRVPFDHQPPELTALDLEGAGIGTVLWASGYRMDYGWIEPPVVDELGFPRQRRGVAAVPGLSFIGSLWQHTQASATLFGLDLDALALARHLGLARPGDEPGGPQGLGTG